MKNNKKIIYLDNAATTKVDERVVKVMLPYFSEKYGNASSKHSLGREAKEAMEKSRKIIADKINAKPNEIIFTSGGTEANNMAIKELFFLNREKGKNHIITTKIEHDSVSNVCKFLENMGAKVTYLDVNKEGLIDLKQLKEAITSQTLMISVIQGNNEIGTLQDIEEIGKVCKEKGVYFHIDACQSFCKTKIDVKEHNLDLITLNGHKLHGPKGIGALYVREGIKIGSLIHGGGHERGLRSGTENIPAIVGFGEAVRISNEKDTKNIEKLREYTIKAILKINKAKINGSLTKRLCNNINVSFRDAEGEAIMQLLEQNGIMISTGSACASNSLKKSHVLKAIGCDDFEINSSIRISLSKYNTKKEIDYFIKELNFAVEKIRQMSPFA